MKPIILIKHDAPHIVADLSRDFEVLEFDLGAGIPGEDRRARARVPITSGFRGAFADETAVLPNLGLICAVGTGYEKIDPAAALRAGDIAGAAPEVRRLSAQLMRRNTEAFLAGRSPRRCRRCRINKRRNPHSLTRRQCAKVPPPSPQNIQESPRPWPRPSFIFAIST